MRNEPGSRNFGLRNEVDQVKDDFIMGPVDIECDDGLFESCAIVGADA